MPVVNTGTIRTLVSRFLAGRIGREAVAQKLKDLGVKPGNVIRAFTGKDAPVSDQGRVKLLRLLKSPDFQKAIGETPSGGFSQLAGEVRDTGLQEKAGKLVANLGRGPRPKGPRTGPKPRRVARQAGLGALPEEQRAVAASQLPTQKQTAEAAVQAVARKFGLGSLALAGGVGFGLRGLLGGGKRDSQAQTQSLVAQLLANQAGTNKQGLVDAQAEKTRLQSALLALKIIEQQAQTAPATIPFS